MVKLDLQFFGGRGASSSANKAAKGMFGKNNGVKTGKGTPIDVSQIQDQRLSAIENSIRTKQHEEAYIYDKNGNLVAGSKGGSGSVALPSNVDYNDATVTHNHPTGKSDYGATLSFADVEFALNNNVGSMRAASSGQGEFNYVLKKGSKPNARGFSSQLSADKGKIESEFKKVYIDSYNKAIKSGKTVSQANHQARQMGTGVIDRYWKDTAPKFGYTYTARNKKYDY